MKKLLYCISILLLLLSCSSDDEQDVGTETPSIKPYSCDVTTKGVDIVYVVTGATKVEAFYKEQHSDAWTPYDAKIEDGIVTINLTNLVQMHYYHILVTVQNNVGMSASDNFTIHYDYEANKGTYFAQPFLMWGALVTSVKTAMEDKGNVLDSEIESETETRLTYRFLYKELRSEYVFDEEKHLKEVLVYFDKGRVNATELRRYINLAFGYLAFGNIHLNVDGIDQACTLFKTAEGISFVIIYEENENIVIDYMSTSSIDITETLYK